MKFRSFNVLIVLALFLSLLGSAVTTTPAYAAGIVVNTNADNITSADGFCTLREAINNANSDSDTTSGDCTAGSGADTITFNANYTITLVFSQLPAITTQMTITGNGAANTIIQASTCNPVTLKDNANANCTATQNYRIFEVGTIGNLTLNDVTVRHGVCTDNLNGCNSFGTAGGGIYNQGALTMTGSVISGNLANYGGGMLNNNSNSTLTNVTFSGNLGANNAGGMYNQNSSSTLTNVTFSGNSAQAGGGMQNDSNLTLTNVTFSNNSATTNDGGGMYNFSNSSPTLTNVTFSGNSAYNSGGGMVNFGGSPTLTNVTFSGNSANTLGGGMYNASSSTPMLTNVIITNSTSGGNCYNDATSLNPASSHNLIDSASSCGLTDGNLSNKIGASYTALLGPLASNGGYTQTHALLAGSPAVDAGSGCPATDQRGTSRPQGSGCDIGSFEGIFTTVTFNANGGSGSMSDQTASSPTALTTNTFTRTGYSFSGWNTAVNGSGTSYANGATYDFSADITLYAQWTATLIVKSAPANDGWILESAEASNAGGSLNSAATTLVLGDDGSDREYRAILHFDTSALPDTAVVTNMTLKVKQQGSVMGADPFSFASLYVDMRKPSFGNALLQSTDFNFAANKVKSAVFNPNAVSGWFSARFNTGGKLYVNRTGVTQLRLYFSTGDNNNSITDFIRFYSGNASAGDRPKLLITYYVP